MLKDIDIDKETFFELLRKNKELARVAKRYLRPGGTFVESDLIVI